TKSDVNGRVLEGLIRGQSMTVIAQRLGITAEEVHAIWRKHLQENYSPWTEIEMRYLSLARLERLLDLLWNQVEAGDCATEGKQTAKVIKVLEKIYELMALNAVRVAEAPVELSKAQNGLLHGLLSQLRMDLLAQLLGLIHDLHLRDHQLEQIRSQVAAQWS